MATANLSKRGKKPKGSFKWPGETGPGRHSISYDQYYGSQPYDPLKNPYRTNAQFQGAINRTADSQLQPRLDDVSRRQTLEESTHTGRNQDIAGLYNTGTQARKDALTAASTALNGLITSNSSLDEGTRQAMNAALRASSDTANKAAGELGVAPVTDNQAKGYQDAVRARTDLGGIGLTGEYSSVLGSLAHDIGTSEVGRREATTNEDARWDSVLRDLTNERTQLKDELPGLREQARQNLTATELTRTGQSEQQRLGRSQEQLANKQFGLTKNQFGEQKKMDKFQRTLSRRQQAEVERGGRRQARQTAAQQAETERSNRANESINVEQIATQRAQIMADAQGATDKATQDELKSKAKRFDKGVEIITDFFKPTKLETGKKNIRKGYNARVTNGYDAMVAQLKSATGAGDIEVRQMILAAVNGQTPWGQRWRIRAQREVATLHRDMNTRAKSKRINKGYRKGDPRAPLAPGANGQYRNG
jgi:hypothetical protein